MPEREARAAQPQPLPQQSLFRATTSSPTVPTELMASLRPDHPQAPPAHSQLRPTSLVTELVAHSPGGAGHNGTKGALGSSSTCRLGAGCSGGAGPCPGHFCGDLNVTGLVTGTQGLCGCRGAGGAGGGPGRGGGASIGIYVAVPGASVVLTNSVVNSGRGGDGSVGKLGAGGSGGTAATPGTIQTCYGDCKVVDKGNGQCNCEQPGTFSLAGGAAGGKGGLGGKGGGGSGGSGGPSYSIVRDSVNWRLLEEFSSVIPEGTL